MSDSSIVIGGGFYGLSIALFLRDEIGVSRVTVIDKEPTLMSRASYVNQARVHNGYHYPRSILTAGRSAANFPRFVSDYGEAVVSDFNKYYAIATVLSKVNSNQFENFSKKIGVSVEPPEREIMSLFNSKLIENVYKVQEYAFDSTKLRDLLLARVKSKPGIIIRTSEEVINVSQAPNSNKILLQTSKDYHQADYVLNTTYSQMNWLHRKSTLPLLPLKHEIAEMALVKLPQHLSRFSVTIMDGPFFSIMPFPSLGLHTLSHVRYTPHMSWEDDEYADVMRHSPHQYFAKSTFRSNYRRMLADVTRFIPDLKGMEYVTSISDVKTVLMKSESDDSRPILFRSDFEIDNYACIMGGKLDNIYDVFDEIKGLYE